jgi:hypothetical protein
MLIGFIISKGAMTNGIMRALKEYCPTLYKVRKKKCYIVSELVALHKKIKPNNLIV